MTTMPNLQAITRLEIIDSTGRAYTAHNAHNVTAVIQDDDRTLKIFATTTTTPHTDTTADDEDGAANAQTQTDTHGTASTLADEDLSHEETTFLEDAPALLQRALIELSATRAALTDPAATGQIADILEQMDGLDYETQARAIQRHLAGGESGMTTSAPQISSTPTRNAADAAHVVDQASTMTSSQARRLSTAWTHTQMLAMAMANDAIRELSEYHNLGSAGAQAYQAAQTAAGDGRGSPTWNAAGSAARLVAEATMMRGTLDEKHYETFAGPWNAIMNPTPTTED